MSNVNETFFTIIGCMDGRVQEARMEFGREKFGAEYPDTITDAGIAGVIAGNPNSEFLENLKKKLLLSIEKHNSCGVLVGGHQECAGNPVSDEEQKEHVKKSAEIVRKLIYNKVPVVSIFVVRDGDSWRAEEL
jgi:carbonic anhydrase